MSDPPDPSDPPSKANLEIATHDSRTEGSQSMCQTTEKLTEGERFAVPLQGWEVSLAPSSRLEAQDGTSTTVQHALRGSVMQSLSQRKCHNAYQKVLLSIKFRRFRFEKSS